MYYNAPTSLPPSGQDSGSGPALQAIMAYMKMAQASDAPSQPMGLNEFGGRGFDPGGASDAAVAAAPGMSYNPSIYGNLGVQHQDNAY